MKARVILRLIGFLYPYRAEVLLSIILGAAAVACGIGLLGTSSYLISAAALHPSVAELQIAIVGVRFFGISRAIFRYLERLVSHSVNFNLLALLRSRYYLALERLAPAGLERIQSGDLLQRAVGDIDILENFYVRLVAPVLVAVVISLGTSLFLGAWDPNLGWILLIGLLLGGAGVPWLAYWINRQAAGQMIQDRSDLSGWMVQSLQGIVDLSAYAAQSRWMMWLEEKAQALNRSQMYLARGGAIVSGLSLLVTNLTAAGMLLAAIPLVRSGRLDGVLLAAITLITLASFEAVSALPQTGQLLESSLAAGGRLLAVMEAPAPVSEPALPRVISGNPAITLRHLSYRYPMQLDNAIADLSIELAPGRRIALVGASGAGKSTLVQILLRLRDGFEGDYLVGGKDVHYYSSDQVRSLFGVMDQRPYLFTASLRQNLLVGDPEADESEIWDGLEKVELKAWAESLPSGLDTWLGDRGAQLSGGQKQRLAAARVLLRDAPYMLLDEPTAHLDALTEKNILHHLLDHSQNKGILLITHRPAVLESMDEIYVLDRGRVAQHGTHQALIRVDGIYAQLWNLQQGMLDEFTGEQNLSGGRL